MNLDTRARAAAESLRTATPVDPDDGLRRLHRTHRRRTTGKVVAAAAVVAAGLGAVQMQRGADRAEVPVSPPDGWVLISGDGEGGADAWAEPPADDGVQSYPEFFDADPATRRFLVHGYGEARQEPTSVMTPGRREPLTTIYCPLAGGHGHGCFGAMLGPGPDELTAISEDLANILVLGADGEIRRVLARVTHDGVGSLEGWSRDGDTWAESRLDHTRNSGRLAIVLRQPDSAGETTLYEYSEEAPPWYDPEEHRFGDGAGMFNDWGAPEVAELRWAPDSDRLAFATMTTPDDVDDETSRHVQWQLFVADAATGQVDRIADLGRCDEPVGEDGDSENVCEADRPALAWTPDGEALSVVKDGTLTTYDLTGKVLESEDTLVEGPIVWLESE